MVTDRRALIVRSALNAVGDELLELDPAKSGSVTVHFQNGIPQRVEWRILARSVQRPLTGTDDDR